MSVGTQKWLKLIAAHMDGLNAADVADLFLSPHIAGALLNGATAEPGPAMWIVNRSDVYDATLRHFLEHSQAEIARRAEDKLKSRHTSLSFLSPPILDGPVEETPDWAVEDVLGHPLVPLEAVFHFARVTNEDHRGSAALSLTRRLLEHPPNWTHDLKRKAQLIDLFSEVLLSDSSPFVRAYAARIPILPADVLESALKNEKNSSVLIKILQAPEFSVKSAEHVAQLLLSLARSGALHPTQVRPTPWNDPALQFVLALDQRLPRELREELRSVSGLDPIGQAIHGWYLDAAIVN